MTLEILEDGPRLLSRAVPFYVVQRGDTLSQVALRCGVQMGRLVQLNGIRNPNLIYPGQLLQLEA